MNDIVIQSDNLTFIVIVTAGLTDLLLMINAELQVAAGRTVAGTELEISSSCLPVFHTITPPFSPENILVFNILF